MPYFVVYKGHSVFADLTLGANKINTDFAIKIDVIK